MSFTNNPAGGGSDLWGTSDSGQEDATLNDLLALYQSASDMPPFAPLSDSAGYAPADLEPALPGNAAVDAEIDELIKSFQEAPPGFPVAPLARPAIEVPFEPEAPVFEAPAPPAPPVFEAPAPVPPAPMPPASMPPAPLPPTPMPPAPLPPTARQSSGPDLAVPSKPPSFDDILSTVQSIVPAASPPPKLVPPPPVLARSVVPLADAGRSMAQVSVATSRDRIALAQQLSEVIANLTGGVDRVQSDLDGLYSELAHAATRRAPVEQILQTTQALSDTKAKLGEGSDLYQQAFLLKTIGEAYMELLKGI